MNGVYCVRFIQLRPHLIYIKIQNLIRWFIFSLQKPLNYLAKNSGDRYFKKGTAIRHKNKKKKNFYMSMSHTG